MALTLTTTARIIRKAGLGANAATIADATQLTDYGEEAEGELIADTRKNWISEFSSINTYVKKKVDNAVACKAALKVVMYDGGGYLSRLEQETLIDILYDEYKNAVQVLSKLDANDIRSVNV